METVRKWVQVIIGFLTNSSWSFPFTNVIYQGPLKVICAPGLNCYSCPAATTYCPMGSIQQLLGGLRFALENGQYYFSFSVFGTIGVLGGLFGRMICGWACPFGFIQELLHKIPSKKFAIPRILSYGKYMFLVVFVVVLPLVLVDEFGSGSPWFCKFVCPAGTLEAGLPMLLLQPNLRNSLGLLFLNKFVIMTIFLIWAVLSSRPFCRTACPLGAFYALFSKVRLIKLQLDEAKCTNCKACHHVCPMGVKFNESPDDPECISCLACMNKACQFDAISLEIGGIPLATPNKGLAPVGKS
ncbi:MAG: 4Fe-4S binding protein [Proteobacteria bacterium]|nr:4Fe-4S binding protein [Pseudomonadota bacterium]